MALPFLCMFAPVIVDLQSYIEVIICPQNRARVVTEDLRIYGQEAISVTADDIGNFLEECTDNLTRCTHHLRYAQKKAFFNYVIEAHVT
jgi:hypothetical protein